MDTSSYYVIQDTRFTLKGDYFNPSEFSRTWEFNITPNAVVSEKAILAFQLDPSSHVDLSFMVNINDIKVFEANTTSGVARSFTEVIMGNILKWQNNNIVFVVTSGHEGSLEFSSIVLWFQTQLPSHS